MANTNTNAPVHKVVAGALSASIWRQDSQGQTFYSVTFQRAYTNDDGKTWQHSDSFGFGDLMTLTGLASEAWRWILDAKLVARFNQSKKGIPPLESDTQ